ncbi:TetR/AcrR family transcriptional regulator [Rhizobium phaseoli]|uniref:TetR family transcriptional regulator protein n=1 Tax=Rhizobium phaseoli TaxID=396 RepID=A0ABM6CLC8_9HYPH|nr:TetR/AcrR family transcriptional regulator [Rhizobium phaseoli]ANL50929.1 TetR family transcriptional regulator protein [Rhizobium phaseoli]ANL88988.1 TetR family transcriptional regulator protein [Rhizobium phaseoli]ANL95497.1 TetR family transcriptional regulator protein [Rhizobium phaseoli]
MITMIDDLYHAPRKGGRPLSFDRDAALQKAMVLFWRYGYEGTSLATLTAALGVKPSSIYTAFGDKKRLFLEAVELYLASGPAVEDVVSDGKSLKEVARELLVNAATKFTGEKTPRGCLLATSVISCSQESMDLQEMLAGIRRHLEAQLLVRISYAIDKGEIGHDANPAALAGLIMAVAQGMSTLARDGASRSHLMSIVDMTLASLPFQT